MEWRSWIRDQLLADADVTAIVADRIYAAGSLQAAPEHKPFVVVRTGPLTRAVADATYADGSLWAHDAPGSYLAIDSLLAAMRNALVVEDASAGFIAVRWQGDSTELVDDGLGTITKNSSYRFVGRTVNA